MLIEEKKQKNNLIDKINVNTYQHNINNANILLSIIKIKIFHILNKYFYINIQFIIKKKRKEIFIYIYIQI